MQETQVRSLGREDPLEKEIETHSSILACKTPWAKEPSGLQSIGSQRDEHNSTNPESVKPGTAVAGTLDKLACSL